MGDRHRRQWERLGAHDPFWAVLAEPSKKGGLWDRAEFFQTGKNEVGQLMTAIEALEITPRFCTALDFGCGVGRLSSALAQYFARVIAVDISQAMLAAARRETVESDNIEFLHNVAGDLSVLADESVDFIYSNIVLQHIPFRGQRIYIREFCRVLAPGGVAVFQAPAARDLFSLTGWVHAVAGNRILNLARRARHGKNGVMEIHVFPKKKMIALLGELNLSLVHVQPDDSTGRGFSGYRYFVRKV